MNKFSAIVLGLLFSSSAFAASYNVKCSDAKVKNGPVVWNFLVKSTQSNRLGSDILYTNKAGTTSVISSLSVAQYVANSAQLYIMVDDFQETVSLVFSADPRPMKAFAGNLREVVAGKAANRALKCNMVLE